MFTNASSAKPVITSTGTTVLTGVGQMRSSRDTFRGSSATVSAERAEVRTVDRCWIEDY